MQSSLFFAAYTVWSIVWIMVSFTYGWASYFTWRQQGGTWKSAPGEILSVARWFVRGLVSDLRGGQDLYPFSDRYSDGHNLRLFVSLSACISGALGVATATVDRSGWSVTLLAMTLTGILLSTLAACGHLSLAWRNHARRYRLFIASLLLLWVPFGILFVLPIVS